VARPPSQPPPVGGRRHGRPPPGVWGNRVSPHPCLRARPSRGEGDGETRFPHPPPRELMFTLGPIRGAHTARCTWPGSAGVPPAARLRGHGDGPLPSPPLLGAGTRRLPPAGGGWEGGCTRRTMVTSAVHAAPPHNAAMNISLFLGGRRPPRPSHRAGAWGNPVSPYPCGAGAWGNPVSPHPSPSSLDCQGHR